MPPVNSLLSSFKYPVNKVLSLFGLRLSRISKAIKQIDNQEKEFLAKYEYYFQQVENNKRGFKAFKHYRYEAGEHPSSIADLICEFAAYHLFNAKPKNLLEVGAWRQFIIGMLSHYKVTTVDVRNRKSILKNETILTCDAKDLSIPNNSFDAVVCIGGFYCFGLGRYGEDFDLDSDIKIFNELVRVLAAGGVLIFHSAITKGQPSIYFNRCKIFNYEMIQGFCDGLDCVEERYLSRRMGRFCSIDEITIDPDCDSYDYYLGCWRKR